MARLGAAWQGGAWQGKDRKGKGALCPIFIFIFIRLGLDRHGQARLGEAWRGKVRGLYAHI